jgi:hypothetical protein
MGKTHVWKANGRVWMIDFDSTFKLALYEFMGLKTHAQRKEFRKTHNAEYEQMVLSYFQSAVDYCKEHNLMLFASDMCVLREWHNEIDLVITMPEDIFIKRCKQRDDYNESSHRWKANIDRTIKDVLGKVSLLFINDEECYLSDLKTHLPDILQAVNTDDEQEQAIACKTTLYTDYMI